MAGPVTPEMGRTDGGTNDGGQCRHNGDDNEQWCCNQQLINAVEIFHDLTILQFKPLSLNLSPEWERLVMSDYQLLIFISLFSFHFSLFFSPFKGEVERVFSLFTFRFLPFGGDRGGLFLIMQYYLRGTRESYFPAFRVAGRSPSVGPHRCVR